MISQVTGHVAGAGAGWLDIRPRGLGIALRASVTVGTVARFGSLDKEVTLYTRVNVGDDGPSLYGFETTAELELFEKLISVSGVGPRLALRMLSALPPDRLITAMNAEDTKTLQTVPGVGARTAGRLVVELKGKLAPAHILAAMPDGSDEALEALLALGYSRAEAMDGIARAAGAGMTIEDQISAALKALARR